VLIGLFKLLNTVFLKAVNEQAKETPKEEGGEPNPTKAGIPPCRLSAHILSYGFFMPCKRQALISSLPSHPNFARFYRCASILFFDSYILLCLTSLTAVHLICGLAVSLRVHSFVLFIFEVRALQMLITI
jgi:hypothetical protein